MLSRKVTVPPGVLYPITPLNELLPAVWPQLSRVLLETVTTVGAWETDAPPPFASDICRSRQTLPFTGVPPGALLTFERPALMMRLFVAELTPTTPRPNRIASPSWFRMTLSWTLWSEMGLLSAPLPLNRLTARNAVLSWM